MGYRSSIRSKINILDEQRQIIVELVEILDSFQAQDPEVLRKGKGLAVEIALSPQKAASLMRKAKEHSSNANNMPPKESTGYFFSHIQSVPGITAKELHTKLKEEGITNLGTKRVYDLLKFLVAEGKIEYTTEKGVKKYSAAEKG